MKIKVGDKLPRAELFYLDQSNDVKKIDILDLCKNDKAIILGMPGAFTKTCSAIHLPGYIKNYDLALKKGVSKIYEKLSFICVPVALNSGSVWPKSGRLISNKTITISILEKIPVGLNSEDFLRKLENQLYDELEKIV